MPFSAWVTLAIAIVVLFGGLAWSITITLRKNNEK
ncbi:MetS family NSS transporter small subunit [bacterium]|nr:MetS family NSS transporter small subunit [bacterium]